MISMPFGFSQQKTI